MSTDNRECPQCDGTGRDKFGIDDTVTCDLCAGTGRCPDHMLTPSEAEPLWRDAWSLPDLGQLTARWLRGELPTCLTYYGTPDDETGEIRDVLVALNEAGYLTDFSQPAHDWTVGWDGVTEFRQRAAVTFLLDETRADVARTVADRFGLWVKAGRAPRSRWTTRYQARRRLPVTEARREGEVFATTGVGFLNPRSYWRWVGRTHATRHVGRVLADAVQVTVVDLNWGRNEVLWDDCTRELLKWTP